MQRLTSFCAWSLLPALLFAVAGCGGGSSAPTFRFAGTYAGSFVQNSTPVNVGSVNVTIDNKGNVTGTTANAVGAGTSALSGSVSSAGTAAINVLNSNASRDTATGTFAFNLAGDLVGSLTNAAGNPVTITVASNGRSLPFSARYNGNFTRSDGSTGGTIFMTIMPDGTVSGSATIGTTSTPVTGTISRLGVTSLTRTSSSGTSTSLGEAGFDSSNHLIIEVADSSGVTTVFTLNGFAIDPP